MSEKLIKVGDKFKVKIRPDYEFERLPDDPNSEFECERIIIKVIYPKYLKYKPSVFGTEQEWFKQRGLVAE